MYSGITPMCLQPIFQRLIKSISSKKEVKYSCIKQDTQFRQTYDFGTSSLNHPKSELQAMYTVKDISYWEELFNRANGNETTGNFENAIELDQATKKYLSDIYKIPIRTISRPTNSA
ncbi:Hypothetical predicted protein [Mytilus galloprovincialis]|uniref:Uncharacterized protein n=1 Tax=Mytilus galloprovincialis TaxID=29158 RepID=A0A8B6GWS3_MYTGA|nr:Hypothetical predicted protein [Mytilus galloprovincialis]